MNADSFISWLQWLVLAGSALTALKLYALGLYKRYPVLCWYFFLRVPNTIWPLFLDIHSPLYRQLWLITEPVFLGLHVLLVLELVRLVLERYKGLQSLLRWAVCICGVIALSISIVSVVPQMQRTASVGTAFRLVLAAGRAVDTTLAVMLVLLVLLLSRYPVTFPRNVRLYAIAFPLLFVGGTIGVYMATYSRALYTPANIVLQIVYTVSVFSWFFLLNRAGEEVPVSTRHFGPEQEQRLLTQLDALNTTMLKVSRH